MSATVTLPDFVLPVVAPKLIDLVDLAELQKIQEAFARTTGTASLIADAEGTPITRPSNFCSLCQLIRSVEKGRATCDGVHLDLAERARLKQHPVQQTCPVTGLIDAAVPIFMDDCFLGVWTLGQCQVDALDSRQVTKFVEMTGIEPDKILTSIRETRPFTAEQFQTTLDLLWNMTRQVSALAHTGWKLREEVTQRQLHEEDRFAQIEQSRNFQSAIIHMMRQPAVVGGHFGQAVRNINEIAARVIRADRVSIWLFDEAHSALTCADLFEHKAQKHSRGMSINSVDFPNYVQALSSDRVIDAVDACTDNRTSEFAENYLAPLGIVSMLDAGIRVGLELVGVICFEIIGQPREWTRGDCSFVNETASQVAQTLMNQAREIANKQIRESEERFRIVSNQTGQIIFDHDFASGQINWEGAIKEITGYTPDEFQKTDLDAWDDLVHPEDRENSIRMCQKIQLGASRYSVEYRMHHKDGHYVHVEEHGAMTRDDQGNIVRIIGTIKNVTDRKQSELEQLELREELEKAQRMESLGLLAGGVAHDLNNMLGPLVGYPELLLLKLPGDSPLRKHIERLGTSARQAADVIQDLLSLARRGRYEMATLLLNNVITTFIDSPCYSRFVEEHPDVTISVDLDESMRSILGSEPHLAKVIMNLIGNALDAIDGPGRIVLKTETITLKKLLGGYEAIKEGEYAVVRVTDSGIGIKADTIDKIFEPYYSNKKIGRSGTGLGLAVVYGILKDHGGYYDVFSEVGRGTEFILYFPITSKNIKLPEVESKDYSGDETILIIDDDDSQCETAHDLLESYGYKVQIVNSGSQAVEKLREESFDLIILDMIMEKDFDGLDTWNAIRAIKPSQKAIIASGFSSTDRVEQMQSTGAGEYLKKPYTRKALGKAVRTKLNLSQ